MTILGLLLSGVLVVVAALHLLWAVGYWFPIREEQALVRAVVGFRDAERMPGPIPCALVTVALLFPAAAIWWPETGLRTTILGVAAVVLLGRGLVSRLRGWRRITPLEPFATLDRRVYGPLCLVLGVGLALHLI